MDKKFLIINPGSASKKYSIYSGGVAVFHAHLEQEDGGLVATVTDATGKRKEAISKDQYSDALAFVIERAGTPAVAAIGLRIVAPGNYFAVNRLIDDEYQKRLETEKERAPLHITPVLAEIGLIKKTLPGIPLAAISDSAFHSTMADQAKWYGLPIETAGKLEIYRFGYHGISVRSVLNKMEKGAALPSRIIVCHLGNGSSITAVKDGMSFDTSMGFTPLEGLPMGTRVGDIDAGAVVYLAQKLGLAPNELENYFNENCGLKGISGRSGDVRELIELEKSGDAGAARALSVFTYCIQKTIGAYVAALGGLDALIFTATIGERSSIMRGRICRGLESLGIAIDNIKNDATISRDGFIESGQLKVNIAVVTTDEMGEMARETEILTA